MVEPPVDSTKGDVKVLELRMMLPCQEMHQAELPRDDAERIPHARSTFFDSQVLDVAWSELVEAFLQQSRGDIGVGYTAGHEIPERAEAPTMFEE